LKQPMVYVFLIINSLLVFFATATDNVTIGDAIGNIHKNAPYQVENFYAVMTIFSLIMATAFVNVAAARDFFYNSHQIIYSTPLRKFDFLAGRFIGASIVAMIPFLGVSLGNIVGSMMPWVDQSRIGPTIWKAHLEGLLVFVIPNLLFVSSFIFCIAALTRSTITSFMCSIIFLIAYIISLGLAQNIEQEFIASLLDPLGARVFSIATKYWTVEDKNNLTLGLTGIILINRLLWLALGLIIFVFTYFRFSFTEKKKQGKKKISEEEPAIQIGITNPLPPVSSSFTAGIAIKQFLHQTRLDFLGVLKSTPFIVIILAGILNLTVSLMYVKQSFYGGTSFPVTYNVIDSIRGDFLLFLLAIIAFYTGVLVWKERDARLDEIQDALPHKNWVTLLAKLTAMTLLTEVMIAVSIVTGIVIQTIFNYHRYELGQYLMELMVLDGLFFFCLTVLSMLVHTIVNNKYLGYFIFIVLAILNLFIWPSFNIASNMVIFGSRPSSTYSDMNHYGPYIPGLIWFNIYWILFALVLVMITLFFWMRGKEQAFSFRWRNGRQSFSGKNKMVIGGIIILWLIAGGFVFYNSKVINHYDPPQTAQEKQVNYEKKYKQYENAAQPHIVDIKYKIDLFPEERKMDATG
ncbi:MAG: hypothetical protein ACHQD9_08560, partial [Chitinophagales bacterium]